VAKLEAAKVIHTSLLYNCLCVVVYNAPCEAEDTRDGTQHVAGSHRAAGTGFLVYPNDLRVTTWSS
jgi:hypothetical protein